MLTLLVLVVLTAIVFDYINGFHDAANAIATVVSTGVLPVRTAVMLAAVLNFAGAMEGTAVAKTIASGFVANPAMVTQVTVLAALIGACIWNLLTWWWGIPSSSSHALVGALAGAVVARGGWHAFLWINLYKKVLIPLVSSPTVGFLLGLTLMVLILWAVRGVRASLVNHAARRLQLVSASLMAFAHGSNDAQKSMGIITLALLAFVANGGSGLPHWMVPRGSLASPVIPMWVLLACATAIALGTAAGGQRIIKTMGSRIIRITPIQGFAAETAGALTILTASQLGVPVSTTHCISASIMGVGAAKRLSAVRWGVAGNIVTAWILTLPVSGLVAFCCYQGLRRIFGE